MKCISHIVLILTMFCLYTGVIYSDLLDLFATKENTTLFILYTTPLICIFQLIVLQELYRRHVTGTLQLKRFLIQIISGGAMVPILGIVIAPISLSLFSVNAAILVLFGACCGFIGGMGGKGLIECLVRKNKTVTEK